MPATPTDPEATSTRPRALSWDWWIRDRDGHVVLAQLPNPAIGVWLAAVVIGRTGVLEGDRAETLTRVGQGALVAWSVDELLRGASPVRRVLGAVVLAVVLARLFG
jgi:hypothetical protein